jgi:hypothetical protein
MVPSSVAEHFLEDYDGNVLSWPRPAGTSGALQTDRVLFGQGDNAVEVAVASTAQAGQPKADDLRTIFKKRQAGRATPVILVVFYETPRVGAPSQAHVPRNGGVPANAGVVGAVVGTTGDPAPVTGLQIDRLERVCTAVLGEPDRHAAARTFDRLIASLKDQQSPGLVNSGLFASHELRTGVPDRADWGSSRAAALPLLGMRGLPLIHALGYETAPRGSTAMVLTHRGNARAVAMLLTEAEVFDRPSARFGAVTPVAHGLSAAAKEELSWLIVLRGTQIRLYPASPDVGVGRKGQGETYAELDLALLSEQEAAYLALFFSPAALVRGGTVEQILESSGNFAANLGKRLRTRVYEDVVPALAVAIAEQMGASTEAELAEAYHRTLLVLFRLLFLAYAEDRGLLPYLRNPRYDRHAVKTLARDFAADRGLAFDPNASSYWDDMLTVWRAIDEGNSTWDVPAYNGGLFSRDPETSPAGAALASAPLADTDFGPALRALLVDSGEDGTEGPVDFRSLGVREFGTIYEGLLESELSVAQADLTVDAKTKAYLPAKSGDEVIVPGGRVYVHNKSGQRKSTGSYFTKQFAVEHLLDSALEPALTSHLARVADLLAADDEAAAAEAFFDFRMADPAMGSAHFLVAAIDRIEARFTAFLAEHPIPAVADELARLERAAREALGDQAANVDIETGALLRRQIARRCVYGLDLNLIAVELARVSIWIHTFVPGLPMSSLDHNLVVGNSLTGIATVDELLGILEPQRAPGQVSLFADEVTDALQSARDRLLRAARTAEATKAEVREAAKAHAQAMRDAATAKALMDAAVGVRLGLVQLQSGPEEAIRDGKSEAVQNQLARLQAAHLPYLFPEVFLRDNPGFDAMLGNPPWEKVKVEEHQWWGLRFPGLRSMPQKEKNAAISRYRNERPDLVAEYDDEVERTEAVKNVLGKGDFPGLRAATDTDLSVAFAWRFWKLLRDGGRSGVVLPRGILAGRATAQWRTTVLEEGAFDDVTNLSNSRTWIFEEVHPQYTIGLVTLIKGRSHAGSAAMRGPYFSLDEYRAGMLLPAQRLPVGEFAGWADGAPFPLLPQADSLGVFLKLRAHPRLDAPGGGWKFIPFRELHTVDNKSFYDFNLNKPAGDLPVLTGASFNLWNPNYGDPYAYAKAAVVLPWLQERRRRQVRLAASAFYQMPTTWAEDKSTLPCLHPRIAFRDVCRATDTRTMICAFVPGGVALVEKAPYLVQRSGSKRDEAYLLGVLSSIPFDWYTRRFVELKMSYGLLNTFPVPRPAAGNPLLQRVVEIAGRLAAVDQRYAEWALAVGVPVGSVTTQEAKDDLIAELDAVVAHLYCLDRADVEHIFETFHRGWDYQGRLGAVLAHYDRWAATTQEERIA